MTGRKRSGFHNHWKAYLFHKGCPLLNNNPLPFHRPIPIPHKITYITLPEISTYNAATHRWILNKNTIIQKYQILVMPMDDGSNYLEIDGLTFQNNGVILYDKNASTVVSFSILNNGSFINNNIWEIGNSDVKVSTNGTLINNGNIVNNAYFYNELLGKIINKGIINNKTYLDIYSTFYNYGLLINNNINIVNGDINYGIGLLINYNGATIKNYLNMSIANSGKITNNGNIMNIDTIYNSNFGIILNNSNGKIINDGAINNFDNSIITNNGYIKNNYTINNADGTLTCGTATINGSHPIIGNAITNSCP